MNAMNARPWASTRARSTMKYKVTQEWHYTVDVEVEADSEREAKDKANSMDGDRNHDDHLYDATATEIGE